MKVSSALWPALSLSSALLSSALAASADSLLQTGNYAQAYSTSVQNGDEVNASIAALAQGLYRSGPSAVWLDRAEVQGRKAVQQAPSSAEAHFVLASALGQQADRAPLLKAVVLAKETQRELQKALSLKPGYPEAVAALARWNAATYARAGRLTGGNPETARQLAAQALAQAPGNLLVLTMVGYTYFDLKDRQKGQDILNQAIRLPVDSAMERDAQAEVRAFLNAHP